VSWSTDEARSWLVKRLPTEDGKTQYFPMLDVDRSGGLHAAYYQNEGGLQDGGVLNATTANVYYTRSEDGGGNWSPPIRINRDENTLRFPDPPPDRAPEEYYLIGDYAQLRAAGERSRRKVYVLWTGYDDRRTNERVGETKARVLCTTIACVDVPVRVANRVGVKIEAARALSARAAQAPSRQANRLRRKASRMATQGRRIARKAARRMQITPECLRQLEDRYDAVTSAS
jgi:hypothetical protein